MPNENFKTEKNSLELSELYRRNRVTSRHERAEFLGKTQI
jgi:hypothetical protein